MERRLCGKVFEGASSPDRPSAARHYKLRRSPLRSVKGHWRRGKTVVLGGRCQSGPVAEVAKRSALSL